MRLKVFDLLNKRKRLRVLEDGNQQVQVQCEIINVNSPPPPSSVVSPSLTHSPLNKISTTVMICHCLFNNYSTSARWI